MYLQVLRLKDDGKSTVGTLHVNGTFECFTLEDTYNEIKIPGKTRIPAGKYEIKLRTEGGMTKRYSKRYGDTHKGMLWLQNVENFEWVYIHIGNDADDTEGCILVGHTCSTKSDKVTKQTVMGSAITYINLYTKILAAFDRDEDVTVEII